MKPIIPIFSVICLFTFGFYSQAQPVDKPLRVAIHGMTHSHVHGLLGRAEKGDIKIVGIAEPNQELAQRYAKRYELPFSLLYEDLSAMLKETKPEAVLAFNSIYGHLETVETCAPLGIHVMVEKPLTYRLDHLKKMNALVEKHSIQLLTNYETTWYPTVHAAYETVHEKKALGELRKIVVMDGHEGPKEIGVNPEFLEWLTDPVGNGAGALVDFGCYGANLATWLMKGERPQSVTAVTQQMKPDIYPKVDDEATILLTYPKTQVIIQASWNWPFNRKDMEIYGQTGRIYQQNKFEWEWQLQGEDPKQEKLDARSYPFDDPFAYLAAVLQNRLSPESYNLSSLENNQIAVEILAGAIKSAKTGKTVKLASQ